MAGRKLGDWLLRGFFQYAKIQVLISQSNTASVQKFRGCGYDDEQVYAFQSECEQQSLSHSKSPPCYCTRINKYSYILTFIQVDIDIRKTYICSID